MRRTLTTAMLTVAACLAIAGPARADSWIVTGTGDAPSAPACTEIQPTVHQCPMFRSAVNEVSEAGGGTHSIGLPIGTIVLNSGALTLDTDMVIAGNGARSTTVVADEGAQTFDVRSNADVSMSSFTVAGGDAAPDDGGNFTVSADSSLTLTLMHVTGGVANRGAGILNAGGVVIQLSVFDDNVASVIGGAIYNLGAPGAPAEVSIINSTIANNVAPSGAAVGSTGDANNEVYLLHATVARNIGSAFWFGGPQTATADASIIGPNTDDNCDELGGTFDSGEWNVDSASTCGLNASTNHHGDPLVAPALANHGGETDTLAIPVNSPAVDRANPCQFPYDQRLVPRISETNPNQPCDAGAYEQTSAGEPQPTPTPTPEPTVVPVEQTPVPTPTATPEPTPVFQQSVVAEPVSGKIRVRRPGSRDFVELAAGQAIPLGSTVDSKAGVVEIASVPKAGGKPDTAQFRQGIFRVTQSRGITDLKLVEQLATCPKRAARAAQRKPKSRKLWGKGKGAFRTTGNYSAATIRGTEWLVQDTCAGTLTRVKEGVVSVRDTVKKKTFLLRAPRSYTAKPKRR